MHGECSMYEILGPYHFGCGIMAVYDQERLNYPHTIRNFHPSIGSLVEIP
jgi:hypothetical protein